MSPLPLPPHANSVPATAHRHRHRESGEPMHAARASIPHDATSRRGRPPALAGLVVGLAYAAISVYWAVGGRWLLNTVGISLSQPGQAGHLTALLAAWGAAAVKAVAAVLPLLA